MNELNGWMDGWHDWLDEQKREHNYKMVINTNRNLSRLTQEQQNEAKTKI